METKNPRPGKVEGFGFHRADDPQAYTATASETQLSTDEVEIAPSIHVRRERGFFRLLILPPQALPPSIARPGTHGSHASAMQAARWLSDATGWTITDLAKGG
jgi:hypothetical protein